MIFLIKKVRVFAPEDLGIKDILIAGGQIEHIAKDIELEGEHVNVIDGQGKIAIPGLVDSLVHFSGGGGEGGFHTRTPEMHLTEAICGGVTTLIGALGTDATTRTHTDLLAKSRGLENEGLSTFCYTGSYQLPVRTLTENITDDIVNVDKFIGVGEVAISDHRSSQPTISELARVASESRIGGMLSGKAGVVCIHVGDSDTHLDLLFKVVQQSDIPATQFYPTHINRNQQLLDAGIQWAKSGGYIDFTTSTNEQFIEDGEIPAAEAVALCLQQGVNKTNITMSSDGNASLPVFDENGNLIGLEVGKVKSLFDSFKQLIQKHNVSIDLAVTVVSTNSANILKLPQKGRLAPSVDADLLLLDDESLDLQWVFAKGKVMMDNGVVTIRGTFE